MVTLNCKHFWTIRWKRLPVKVKIANMHTTQTVPREECIKGKQSWTAYIITCLLNSWIPNLSDPWLSTRMLDYSWEAPVILKEASPFILDSMFSEKKIRMRNQLTEPSFVRNQSHIPYETVKVRLNFIVFHVCCKQLILKQKKLILLKILIGLALFS